MQHEIFQFQFSMHIRSKSNFEHEASIKVEATERRTLEKAFERFFADDKHGVIRDIVQKALMKSAVNHNQN